MRRISRAALAAFFCFFGAACDQKSTEAEVVKSPLKESRAASVIVDDSIDKATEDVRLRIANDGYLITLDFYLGCSKSERSLFIPRLFREAAKNDPAEAFALLSRRLDDVIKAELFPIAINGVFGYFSKEELASHVDILINDQRLTDGEIAVVFSQMILRLSELSPADAMSALNELRHELVLGHAEMLDLISRLKIEDPRQLAAFLNHRGLSKKREFVVSAIAHALSKSGQPFTKEMVDTLNLSDTEVQSALSGWFDYHSREITSAGDFRNVSHVISGLNEESRAAVWTQLLVNIGDISKRDASGILNLSSLKPAEVGVIMSGISNKLPPRDAMDVAVGLVSEESRDVALGVVFRSWLNRDSMAASEAVNGLSGISRDIALAEMVMHLRLKNDHNQINEIIDLIDDADVRSRVEIFRR